MSLRWKEAPRNVMIVKKPGVEAVGDALVEFAQYVWNLAVDEPN